MSTDFYHENVNMPVYSYHPLRLDSQEIVNTLLDPDLEISRICKMQPLCVEHNVIFIVDLSYLKSPKDITCDDMGSWRCNGVYHSWLKVDDVGFVSVYGKEKPLDIDTTQLFYLTKKYFVHKTSQDLKKTIAFLAGK